MPASKRRKTAPKPVNPAYKLSRGFNPNDPKSVINEQARANQKAMEDAARYNRPTSETNPFGTKKTIQNPDGSFSEETTLTPDQQAIVDQQESRDIELGGKINAGISGLYNGAFNLDGLGNDPTKMDFSADRRRIEDQIYNRYQELNKDRFAQEDEALSQRLINSGIPVGSELYNKQMMEAQRRRSDENSGAFTNAVQLGGAELSRSTDLGMRARGMAIDERLMQRDRPYQEMANLMGMQAGPQLPNFQARSDISVPGLDITGTSTNYSQINKMGRGGGGRGGGGGGPAVDPNAPYDPNQDFALQRWKYQQDYMNANKPKGPSTGSQIGGWLGGVAGSALSGLGYGLGQKWAK